MNTLSVKSRFLATIITNVLKAGISFVTGLIIARSLGPGGFGNFSFLLESFTALALLIDLSSSSAFYTLISGKRRSRGFFMYYTGWILIQLLLLTGIVLVLPASIRNKIWLGQATDLIFYALLASFAMNQIWRLAAQIGESIRDTVGVQVRNLALSVIYLICILILARFGFLALKNLYLLNVILYVALSLLYLIRLKKGSLFSPSEHEDFRDVFNKFKRFCYPLLPYTLASFFYIFADYWLLQKFGGAVQQGYYAIGARFAALSLIATTSMMQVFWKEISEAYTRGDMERVRSLYEKVSRLFFFITAAMSCLLVPFSEEIIGLLLGPSYRLAWLPLAVMFIYPVHQSLGQILGTMLYAMGKTRAKSYIGLTFMGISILSAYLLLAPGAAIIPGLQLGAVGLSLKMVGCQMLEVSLMSVFVSRFLNTIFPWKQQLSILLSFLALGYLCKVMAGLGLGALPFIPHPLVKMIVAGLIYCLATVCLVFHFPSLAGLKKEKADTWMTLLRRQMWCEGQNG